MADPQRPFSTVRVAGLWPPRGSTPMAAQVEGQLPVVTDGEQEHGGTSDGVENQIILRDVFANFGVGAALLLQGVQARPAFFRERPEREEVAADPRKLLEVRDECIQEVFEESVEHALSILRGKEVSEGGEIRIEIRGDSNRVPHQLRSPTNRSACLAGLQVLRAQLRDGHRAALAHVGEAAARLID